MTDVDYASEDPLDPASLQRGAMPAALNQLDEAVRSVRAAAAERPFEFSQAPLTAEQVRMVIEARQRRSSIFAPELFSDPAWDLLLELYASALENRRPNIAEITVAIDIPATTVLRWLATLEQQALVSRHHDLRDTRKVRVTLSQYGRSQMDRYFASHGAVFA